VGFDIIDLRRFEVQEFSTLLEAEKRAWGEDLRWDFAPSAQIIRNCLQERRLAGYALLCEGIIRGYCFFYYDGEKGLVGDLFVEPSCAGTEQALQLLEHVIETLLGTPGLRRVEAQIPHFRFEDLEPCFASHQFECYLRRFMARPLENHGPARATPDAESSAQTPGGGEAPDGYLIVPWERKHDRSAAELLHWTYRQHVDASINDQYCSVAGATRLVENIVRQHGCGTCLPGMSRVAMHRSTQRLAGILAVTSVRAHTAHIPQIAIAPPFQGHGLGTALLLSTFEDLRQQGYKEISLTVTDANEGAVRLYQGLGFETFRTFGAFVYNTPQQH
jgi:ribosomal protein S18 acetylase RimI-like enzyme